METIKKGKHTIKLVDSADELRIKRVIRYHTMCAIDSGIGSTPQDACKHLVELNEMHAINSEHARKAFENLIININAIYTGIYALGLSFACRVLEIDGEKREDLSDEGLQKTLDELDKIGFTHGEILLSEKEAKKKGI